MTKTHLLVLLNRTVRCLAFLALKNDDMFVRILLVHDFLPRLGSKVCVVGGFPITYKNTKLVVKYIFLVNFF